MGNANQELEKMLKVSLLQHLQKGDCMNPQYELNWKLNSLFGKREKLAQLIFQDQTKYEYLKKYLYSMQCITKHI